MRATTDRVPPAVCMGTLEGFPCPPAMGPAGRSPSGSHATNRQRRLKARVFVQLVFLTGATFATLAVFL